MQKTSNGQRNDEQEDRSVLSNPSAFHTVGKELKGASSPASKRDSGYMTDNSPANFGHQLVFSFEESFEEEDRRVVDVNIDDGNDESSDEEVEMVLSQSPAEGAGVKSDSVMIPPRPQAPLPRTATVDLLSDVNDDGDANDVFSEDVAATRHYTVYSCDRSRRRGHCYFRPISSRAVATQTPNPHCQVIQDAMLDRFQPYPNPLQRVSACAARVRHFSEGEDAACSYSPLPDIIPNVYRDRSVSLPDVPFLRRQRELEVGRELRRISDEFHHEYTAGSSPQGEFSGPGSFPSMSISRFSFSDLWGSLRQLFSSSPTVQRDQDSDVDTDDVTDMAGKRF